MGGAVARTDLGSMAARLAGLAARVLGDAALLRRGRIQKKTKLSWPD
jgi:hypothetical protein